MNQIAVQLPELEMVPLGMIKLGPHHREIDPAAVAILQTSIRHMGLLQPMVVRVIDDDTREIVAGGHRLCALEGMGTPPDSVLPCVVVRDDDDLNRAQMLAENVHRRQLEPLQEADEYGALVDGGHSVADVSTAFGVTPRYVSQRLQLRQLVPAARVLLRDAKLTLGQAASLAAWPAEFQDRVTATVAELGRAPQRYEFENWVRSSSLDAGVALFDLDDSGFNLVEDLFAPLEAGDPGRWSLPASSRPAFIARQRAALEVVSEDLARQFGAEVIVLDRTAGDEQQAWEVADGYMTEPLGWDRLRPRTASEKMRATHLPVHAGDPEDGDYDDDSPLLDEGDEPEEDQPYTVARREKEEAVYDRLLVASLSPDGGVTWHHRGRSKTGTGDDVEGEAGVRSGASRVATGPKLSQTQGQVQSEVRTLIAAGHIMVDPNLALRVAIVQLAKAGTRSYDRHLANIIPGHPSVAGENVVAAWDALAKAANSSYEPLEKDSAARGRNLHHTLNEAALLDALKKASRKKLEILLAAAVTLALDAGGKLPALVRDDVGTEHDGKLYRSGPYELSKFTKDQLGEQIEGAGLDQGLVGKTRKATIDAMVAAGAQQHNDDQPATMLPVFVK